MKKILFTLLPCCAVLCSCVEKNTEALFTEATLTAVLPDSLQMVRFQATAVFTNANTRRSVSSSDFRDGVLAIRLQKGIYSIKIGSGRLSGVTIFIGKQQYHQALNSVYSSTSL